MDNDAPIDEINRAQDQDSAPRPLVPSLTSFVLMAAGATLMIAAVFGAELVRDADVRFSWFRLAIAAFGLLALLTGFAWFLAPPETERGS